MRNTISYSVLVVILVLGLILAVVVPVMAQHGGNKETVWAPANGHPKDVYLVEQWVYYNLTITNYDEDSLEINELWDRIPVAYNGSPIDETTTFWWNGSSWVTENSTIAVTVGPGQSWSVPFSYRIQPEDVSLHPITHNNTMINKFEGVAATGEGVGDTKTVWVVQPRISLEKTVDPDEAQVGESVTYSFIITNTGDCPLQDITLDDDVLGDLTGELPPTLVLNATGEAGDSYSFDYDYEIQAGDPMPLVNTATVRGTAQGFNATILLGAEVSDTHTARVTSEAPPVGGTAYPINTLSMLAPWIALGAAIVAGAVIFVRRRQVRS